MSSGEMRKVSSQDMQLLKVQILIEQCLQLYMSQKEVVTTLLVQEKIEPCFTELVWAKLEEQNPEFFKAYHLRLLVKEQIREFNNLLARHVELKHQVVVARQAGGGEECFLPSISNGSHIPSVHRNSTCYIQENSSAAAPKTEKMLQQQPISTTMPTNGLSIPAGHVVSPNLQGVNGNGIVKTESSSCYIYGGGDNNNNNNNVITVNGDAAAGGGGGGGSSCFSSAEPTSTLLDADTSSFGYFGDISPNFALSGLTTDFSNSFDIVESYSGSPFLAAGISDSDNFLDTNVSGDHHPGEFQGLNNQPEGLGYEDFGSD